MGRGLTQPLTQVEFEEPDFEVAERIAKRLGYTQTAYTSTSALWGLFCLRDRVTQKAGCIIKTKELGFMFVQCADEDLNIGRETLNRWTEESKQAVEQEREALAAEYNANTQ